MIRALVVAVGLLTAVPAMAFPHIGFRGPRIGFVAPRVVVAPPIYAPPVYAAPVYGGYYARPWYGPRYEHRFVARGPAFGRGFRR